MREVGLFRDGSEAAINLSLSLMLKNGELIKESWGYLYYTHTKKASVYTSSKQGNQGHKSFIERRVPIH